MAAPAHYLAEQAQSNAKAFTRREIARLEARIQELEALLKKDGSNAEQPNPAVV